MWSGRTVALETFYCPKSKRNDVPSEAPKYVANARPKYKLQAYGLEHFIFYLVFIPDQRQTRYKKI